MLSVNSQEILVYAFPEVLSAELCGFRASACEWQTLTLLLPLAQAGEAVTSSLCWRDAPQARLAPEPGQGHHGDQTWGHLSQLPGVDGWLCLLLLGHRLVTPWLAPP